MGNEHILVCISSSQSSETVIQRAYDMVHKLNAKFTCLYVESNREFRLSKDNDQLQKNISLAKEYGANTEVLQGENVAILIADYVRTNQITKIFIGDSTHFSIGKKKTLSSQLLDLIPTAEIFVIPVYGNHVVHEITTSINDLVRFNLTDFLICVFVLFAASCIGFFFFTLGFTESNIIVVYILGVLIISVTTKYRIYSLISSVVSVLIFNYFFTVPRFSLQAYDSGYPVTFFVMFLSAFITSSLAVQLKDYAKESSKNAFRMKTLLEANQKLQDADDINDTLEICAKQILKLSSRSSVIYGVEKDKLGKPIFCLSQEHAQGFTDCIDINISQWVFENNRCAGFGTDRFAQSKCLYLAIRTNENVYGVIAIDMREGKIKLFEYNLILSILGETALALENLITRKEKKESELLARNEQLRANLLRSISHDLRTPLTSISGNADNLITNGNLLDENTKEHLYHDIYDESLWLINLVENLLAVTRLEGGKIQLNLTAQIIDEVIEEAIKHVSRHSNHHKVVIHPQNTIVLAMMDVRLIVQVLINLLDNAIKYAPEYSDIDVYYFQKEDKVYIEVADQGPGIKDEEKKRIFEMFYTDKKNVSDCRRSMGLGLFLCQSVVKAHGGNIWVEDNDPVGSKFIFSLPVKEVALDE